MYLSIPQNRYLSIWENVGIVLSFIVYCCKLSLDKCFNSKSDDLNTLSYYLFCLFDIQSLFLINVYILLTEF